MAKHKKGVIRIGTSNVVVPGNKTTFPQEYQDKSRLHYYASLFNTVEINSSFYKIPQFSTYQKWSLDVPDDFRFSLKLTRDVTHVKDLQYDLEHIEKFMQPAAGIGDKKGCILVQFPGKITLDHFEQVETIIQKLHEEDPQNEWRKAIEFRSPTWYTGETFELLDEYNAALVLHDIPKSKNLNITKSADFVYIRFHGPTGDYRDSYSESALNEKAAQINDWLAQGKDVFAYFNNTIGDAFNNAIDLDKKISFRVQEM